MPPVPAAHSPVPPGVVGRFSSVVGEHGFQVIQRCLRAAGFADGAAVPRLAAAARRADALMESGYWCGRAPREFVLLFRTRRRQRRSRACFDSDRTGHDSRECLLLAAAGFLAAEVDPDDSAYVDRLRAAAEDRVRAATALLDRDRYLTDFEEKYAPQESTASSAAEPGLVGRIALGRAGAEVGEKSAVSRDLAHTLTVDALNHLDGLSETYANPDRNPGRAIGLPVPAGPPDSPLSFWVARVVSNRITVYLRGDPIQPDRATGQHREIQEAARVERHALGLLPSVGLEVTEITDYGIHTFDHVDAVAVARERDRDPEDNVLFLREGMVATLRLNALAASLATARYTLAEKFQTTIGRALRSVALPASMPDTADVARAGSSSSSSSSSVLAIDSNTMEPVELPEAKVEGVETMRLEELSGEEGACLFRGRLRVTLVASSLPHGTYPGGFLMVLFPLRMRRSSVCFSTGADVFVEDVAPDPDGRPRLRISADIEESFHARLVSSPRLDRSGVKVFLVPTEVCGNG